MKKYIDKYLWMFDIEYLKNKPDKPTNNIDLNTISEIPNEWENISTPR
jgi:hypothetical protein